MLRAVIFDLDDTLVDQAGAARKAVVEWAATHGIRGENIAEKWAGISEVHYERYQRRELTFAQQRGARVREFLGVDASDAEAEAHFAKYLALYEAAWEVFDDAVPALKRAKADGFAVGVLTNGDHDHQSFKLDKMGLAEHVDVFVASMSLPAGKPHPSSYLTACERLGVSADEALMVGNSLEKDVRGALAAGLDAVLLDRHGHHVEEDVRRVSTLADLTWHCSRP